MYPRSMSARLSGSLPGWKYVSSSTSDMRGGRQAVQVDLEAGAGADDLAERGGVAGGAAATPRRCARVRSSRLSITRFSFSQRRTELALVVRDEAGELARHVVDARDQVAQRLPAFVERGEQQVAVGDQLVHLSRALSQGVGYPLGVGEQLFQRLVALVETARQVGDAVECAAQLGGGVVQACRSASAAPVRTSACPAHWRSRRGPAVRC